MIVSQSFRQFMTVSCALSLAWGAFEGMSIAEPKPGSVNPPLLVSVNYRPPNRGTALGTAGGGVRGNSCVRGAEPIQPLIPQDRTGLTLSARPTFFAYIPSSNTQPVRFILRNDQNQTLYRQELPEGTSGIVGVHLPESQVPGLEIDKVYRWSMVIICDKDDSSANIIIDSWIQRIQPDPVLAKRLERTVLNGRPKLYAESGIWYETVMSLLELKTARPQDPKLMADWVELLNSVDLNNLSQKPLADCCTVKKQ